MNVLGRIFMAVILTTLCLIAWWVGGFDFNERGRDSVFCFLCGAVSFAGGLACPLLDD